jgi:RNA polymerase sigma factor (TIGR02999 family)
MTHTPSPEPDGHVFEPQPSSPASGEAQPPTAEMVALMYDELRALAAGYFARQAPGHTLQPTALVHEAIAKFYQSGDAGKQQWRSRSHFLAVAATAMRQILVDRARAKAARKRGAAASVSIDVDLVPGKTSEIDVLELHELIDRFAARDERAARVVVLKFFAGLTIAQIAEVLGVSDFTVENDWRVARAWLGRELRRDRSPGSDHP